MSEASDLTDLTQPVSEVAEAHDLKRSLGPVSLIMLGIGSIIGAGIFVIAGTAAAEHAGPAVLISFVIAGLGCLFAGLCYAEFASMIPESGSAYTYAYATMGRFMAWFIGWNMVLEYGVSSSTVAVGWSGYFVSFLQNLGIRFPAALANAPLAGTGFHDMHMTGAFINVPAVLLIIFLTTFLVVGVSESARFNALMVMIKTAIVILVIIFGLPHVHLSNLHPFIPPNQGTFGKFGVTGILAASGMIFFAYIGFEAVSVAAQEAKNPRRDVPIGILGSLAICTVLYAGMAIVLTGITDWRTLDVPNPVSFALGKIATLQWIVMPINILADLVSIGTLLAFVAVCGGILILRRTAPRARRPFRTPYAWFVAPAGIASCGLMMFSLADGTWVRLVLWTAIGFVIYFVYGIWHAAPSKWKVLNEGG
jgi:APA family basic amino acid/polyamine antiporter